MFPAHADREGEGWVLPGHPDHETEGRRRFHVRGTPDLGVGTAGDVQVIAFTPGNSYFLPGIPRTPPPVQCPADPTGLPQQGRSVTWESRVLGALKLRQSRFRERGPYVV